MLDTFRKHSQHWIIKILFGLLIISFGAWGIGDVLRLRAASQPAITVGKAELGPRQVTEEFRRQAQQLISMSKGKITLEQMRQMGMLDNTIQQMVSRLLLQQENDRLKLAVSDDALRELIFNEPAFQNAEHKFDKVRYEQALGRANMTEESFLAEERENILRSALLGAVEGGLTVPAAEVDALFRYANEQRVAETIVFPLAKMADPAKADDALLKTYYEGHKAQFMAPELRSGVAVVLRAEDYAADVKLADADIEKAYQARQTEFIQPDRRTVTVASFQDEAQAKAFADAVHGGKDFAAAAKDAGTDPVEMGTIEPKTIAIPELSKPVFALTAPGITAPVKSALGWHVAKITAVQAGKSKSLAEVRDVIVRDLVKSEAQAKLYPVSIELEDQIGAGASLEEAATSKNLKLIKIPAVDAEGKAVDGKPAAALPPAVLTALFKGEKGTTGSVEKMDDESDYYAIRVDDVTAPAARPFEQIKDQVAAAWAADEKQRAARKAAEAAVERLNKGEALAAVAGSAKSSVTQPLRRQVAQDSPLPPTLPSILFGLKVGAAAVVDDPSGDAYAIRLKTIQPADPAAQQVDFRESREQLAKAMGSDVMVSYRQALSKDLSVSVNRPLIDSQFEK